MPGPKIAVIMYSMYGHISTMAKSVVDGLNEGGADATLYQVPETLPEEVLGKMGAPPKDESIPIITADMLPDFDGLIFGIPTRFGMAATQMKSFLDSTGGLWMAGKLVGKPAGVFVSTATLGGGQETTAMTWVTQFVHHGMVYVPMGYSSPKLMDMTEVHGGSPWGPGCLAGTDGSRLPSALELDLAKHYGTYFSGVAKKLMN